MIHTRLLEAYINFALIYTTDYMFTFLTIKYLINEYSEPSTPFKLATGTKPSVSHLCVLFCPCGVRKATAHVAIKALNMRHQAQNIVVVSSLELQSIKKSILCTYHTQGR